MPQNWLYNTSIAAAWMLVGKEIFPDWPSWPKTGAEAIALAGASSSQAYQVASRLRQQVSTLLGKPGRPPSPPPKDLSLLKVSKAVQDYLMRHPGSAYQSQEKCSYNDGFRRFVVGLVETGQPGEGLTVADLAEATCIPLGTLKDWFSGAPHPQADLVEPAPKANWLRDVHLHQIITLFQSWKGTFQAFCQMVREQHRLSYGMTFIGNLLHKAGLRYRKAQKPKQAPWSHDTFRALFPGAQWLGDGTSITVSEVTVIWGNKEFAFNLEVILDVASNALLGFAVSDFEDEAVLLRAYEDARATAGKDPLSLSLDNRTSNHTPSVLETVEARGETALLATTLGRGESKAPLEGAFGLFKQELPALIVTGENPRDKARSVLELVFTAWARGRNGRPRKKLGDKSPAQFYQEAQPTAAETEDAKQWIQKLKRRQEQLRLTREARADQAKLELLRRKLGDLFISDPGGRLALSLAYYSRDAIINGLAIFQAKKALGKLPSNADHGRYLGGIIRNADNQAELELCTEYFIKNRELLRDLSLRSLMQDAAQLQCSLPPQLQVRAFVDRALDTKLAIDYHFWAVKSAQALAELPTSDHRLEVYQTAARRIAATFKADYQRKQALLARLAKAACQG